MCVVFFLKGTATPEIYTLSLHGALPISEPGDLVAALYLAVLSRPPSGDESGTGVRYLAASKSRREGAEDLAWALLNSPEFLFNH